MKVIKKLLPFSDKCWIPEKQDKLSQHRSQLNFLAGNHLTCKEIETSYCWTR